LHLYLHIPFCHQACHYCDFHFSTHTAHKKDLIHAICKEIILQKDYLPSNKLNTIYFGGGTPSLLSPQELEQIFHTVHQYFLVENNAEITFEANPEDLSESYLTTIKSFGINRLSIGIQSFKEENLRLLNRSHTTEQAINCISKAQKIGIDNISIDLIYGIPGNDLPDLASDIQKAVDTNVTHISAYSLTIEPKTVFGQQKKKGVFKELPESMLSQKFTFTRKLLTEKGFEAYETSNFAKNQKYSKHNTSYWNQEAYLGVGPSAHSFNQQSRQWNIAKNGLYKKEIEDGKIPAEIEILTEANKINEYLMTRLRTKWGIDLSKIKQNFNALNVEYPENTIRSWQNTGLAIEIHDHLVLTEKGSLVADKLASDLFIV